MEEVISAASSISEILIPANKRRYFEDRSDGHLVSGALTHSNLKAVGQELERAVRAILKGNEFEQDNGVWSLLNSYHRTIPSMFALSLRDENLATRLQETYASKENFSKLHNDPEFMAELLPLRQQMLDTEQAIEGVKRRISAAMPLYYVPIAKPSSWQTACEFILEAAKSAGWTYAPTGGEVTEENPTGSTGEQTFEVGTMKKVLIGLFVKAGVQSIEMTDAHVETAIKHILPQYQSIKDAQWEQVMSESFEVDASSDDEVRNLALMGSIGRAITWVQLVGRLTSMNPLAPGMMSHQALGSYASATSVLLETCLDAEIDSSSDSPVKDDTLKREFKGKGESEDVSPIDALNETLTTWNAKAAETLTVNSEHHLAALALHVLQIAGASITVSFGQSTHHPVNLPCGNVPLNYFMGYSAIRKLTRKAWKALAPKEQPLKLIKVLTDKVASKRGFVLKEARRDIAKAVQTDVRAIAERVKTALVKGEGSIVEVKGGPDAITTEAFDALVEYETKLIKVDKDLVAMVDSDVDDFISSGLVMDVTRPIGSVDLPVAGGVNMQEVFFEKDPYAFDIITHSAGGDCIASLFNHAIEHTAMPDFSDVMAWDANAPWLELTEDLSNGRIKSRADRKSVSTLMASSAFPAANFNPRTDYTVYAVEKVDSLVTLAPNVGRIKQELTNHGSCNESFAFGKLVPEHMDLSTPFMTIQNEMIGALASFIMDSYAMRPQEIMDHTALNVKLQEENKKYIDRLPMLAYFKDVEISPSDFTMVMAGMMKDNASLTNIVSPSIITRINRCHFEIREDFENMLDMIIADYMRRVVGVYSKSMIDKIVQLFSEHPTDSMILEMADPNTASMVRSIIEKIIKFIEVLPKDVEPLRLLVLKKFIEALPKL